MSGVDLAFAMRSQEIWVPPRVKHTTLTSHFLLKKTEAHQLLKILCGAAPGTRHFLRSLGKKMHLRFCLQ